MDFVLKQIEDENHKEDAAEVYMGGIKITPNKNREATIFMRNGSKIGCSTRKI